MARTPSTMVPLGTAAAPFALPSTDGKIVSLSDFSGRAVLVMFICNHCPFVVLLREALAAFGDDYLARGLGIVAICSNDAELYPADGPAAMAIEKARAGYAFDYLHDADQAVAHAYRAACTPDFFLYDAAHQLAYRGQFDSARPGNGIQPTGVDLRAACDAVLAGQSPSGDQVPSIGCNIKWKPGNAPA